MSEWRKALQLLGLDPDALQCPRCHTANRPQVIWIEVDETGHCACNACGHMWCWSPEHEIRPEPPADQG